MREGRKRGADAGLPRHAARTLEALLTGPARSAESLRKSVLHRAIQITEGSATPEQIPGDTVEYVDKVVKHAYRITDEDVQRLRERGYSEDEIFEVTLCAAMGAGLARLRLADAALEGAAREA